MSRENEFKSTSDTEPAGKSTLVSLSVAPSFFVKATEIYSSWCSIVECQNCGLRAKSEDLHPIDPCPRCGRKFELSEKVGRWVKIRPWWKWWGPKGYWEILEQNDQIEK